MRLLYATPSLPHPLFLSTLPLPCTRSCGPRNQEPFLRPKQPASKTAGWFSLFLSILSSFLLYFTTFGRFRLIMCVHVCLCACRRSLLVLRRHSAWRKRLCLRRQKGLRSRISSCYTPLCFLQPPAYSLTHSHTHTHTHTHTHGYAGGDPSGRSDQVRASSPPPRLVSTDHQEVPCAAARPVSQPLPHHPGTGDCVHV